MSYAQRMNNAPAQQPAVQVQKPRPQSAKPAAAPAPAPAVKAQNGNHAAASTKAVPTPAAKAAPVAAAPAKKDAAIADVDTALGAPVKKIAGYANVKCVTSGDSFVVEGKNGVEKRIAISSIVAPKFGNREQADEPYAWYSREFLRKKLLGKTIHFMINSGGKGGRDYADVSLKNDKGQDEDIATAIVAAGWARVKQPKEGKLPEGNTLFQLEKSAESACVGVFSKKDPKHMVREMDYNVDALALFTKCKNYPIPAVVEKVIDGSTLRVELLDPAGSLKHKVVNLNLAGVSCPKTPMPFNVRMSNYQKKLKENPALKEGPPKEGEKVADGAMEAVTFVEQRLLNQDVQVILQGCDKMNNLFGTIGFHKGNISAKLLEKGFGNLVEWSMALCHPNDQKALRDANNKAKATKSGLFHSYDASKAAADEMKFEKDFRAGLEAKVVQIMTGDSFTVLHNGEEVKCFLASVRAPRIQRGRMMEPYAFESREHLRKKIVGKKVKVTMAYKRDQDGPDGPRMFVDLLVNGQNVATEMLEKGLLECIRHGKDEDRTRAYDAYMVAEHNATNAHTGKHSKKPNPPPQIADLTILPTKPKKGTDEEPKVGVPSVNDAKEIASRAKLVLNSLKGSQHGAIVEYVFSGARFKLYVPHISSYISFALADIRVPSKPKGDAAPNTVADEAQAFSRSKLLNHDVTIEVISLGKGDVFTGNLFFGGKTNFSLGLLKQGMASIFGYGADRSPFRKEMQEAEKAAKAQKLRVWVDYDEAKEAEELAKANAEKAQTDENFKESNKVLNVIVTDIVSPVNFYVNTVGDKNIALVAEKMGAFVAPAAGPEPFKPAKGTICAGLFSEDNKWYRCRVDNMQRNADGKTTDFSVQFIDFGNCTVLSEGQVAPLEDAIIKIPQVAKPCTLAALKGPKANSEYTEPACNYFHELTFDTTLTAKVELADLNGLLHVTLTSKDANINTAMLEQGWVKINNRPHRRLTVLTEDLEKFEETARINHTNIWEYGDISDGEGERDL